MLGFRKKASEPIVNEIVEEVVEQPQEVMKTVALPIVLNPTEGQDLEFANYRADAIAREFEQRRGEMRPPHPDSEKMFSEAMKYAYMLVENGYWVQDQIDSLVKRLKGI